MPPGMMGELRDFHVLLFVSDVIKYPLTYRNASWYDAAWNATWNDAAWYDAAWYDAAWNATWYDAAWYDASWYATSKRTLKKLIDKAFFILRELESRLT